MTASIDQRSKISIGLTITLVAAMFGCAAWVSETVADLRQDMNTLRENSSALRMEIEALKNDKYTKSEAAEQALRLAMANPGMRVPDPRNPGQYLVVDAARITD